MKKEQMKYFHKSEKQDWETPDYIFDALNDEFGFTLDPCSSNENRKCEKYYTIEDDGLTKNWENDIVYMNPPYSGAEIWMKKAYEESKKGATVVCLVPARTDSKWWHRYAMKGEIRLFTQRLKFKRGGKRSDVAPFPSAIIVFRPPEHSIIITDIRVPTGW